MAGQGRCRRFPGNAPCLRGKALKKYGPVHPPEFRCRNPAPSGKRTCGPASRVTRTQPSSILYLMAFSTRFVMAGDSFISSTSAVTSRMLSKISSTLRRLAMGRSRFKICSTRTFKFTWVIFNSASDLSILTRDNRSSMILLFPVNLIGDVLHKLSVKLHRHLTHSHQGIRKHADGRNGRL